MPPGLIPVYVVLDILNTSGSITPTSCGISPIPPFLNANVTGGTVSNFAFNNQTHLLEFDLDMDGVSSVQFLMNITIDCSVIPTGGASQSLTLGQTWNSTLPSVTFLFTPPGTNVYSESLAYPYIEIVPGQQTSFTVSYNNAHEVKFEYQNTSGNPVVIDFQFGNTQSCSFYDFSPNIDTWQVLHNGTLTSPVNFIADGTTWNTNGMDGIELEPDDKLILKRSILVTGCIASCGTETALFRWRCHNLAGNIPIQLLIWQMLQLRFMLKESLLLPRHLQAKLNGMTVVLV
jgi:hypothetical protein